jgi:tRNA 5-methylaminomethyl-2-thiouridine biosynthesis bifunctional protein
LLNPPDRHARNTLTPPANTRQALVIGAGLAGAATCAALARRGWRITLVDAASGPAQAASSLPVGMLSPHVTRAPTPLSRLSALGVTDTLRELKRLVAPGHGWQVCEVYNLDHDLGRWPAAMVRPAALVQAWLSEAKSSTALEARWSQRITALRHGPDGWQALDEQQSVVAQAQVVVLACAYASAVLLRSSWPDMTEAAMPLRPVKGQMSLAALQTAPLAARPQRQAGVFVPEYEDAGLPPEWPERIWAMGSTYARGEDSTTLSNEAHQDNARSLAAMHPLAAERLRADAAAGRLLGWAQVRCASLDRLPLVGAVPDLPALQRWMDSAGSRRSKLPMADAPRHPGLYLLTALGSRGLSLAYWCAKLLAEQIDEPTQAAASEEADLIRSLDPARFAWKLARRQPIGMPTAEPTTHR